MYGSRLYWRGIPKPDTSIFRHIYQNIFVIPLFQTCRVGFTYECQNPHDNGYTFYNNLNENKPRLLVKNKNRIMSF